MIFTDDEEELEFLRGTVKRLWSASEAGRTTGLCMGLDRRIRQAESRARQRRLRAIAEQKPPRTLRELKELVAKRHPPHHRWVQDYYGDFYDPRSFRDEWHFDKESEHKEDMWGDYCDHESGCPHDTRFSIN